MNVSHSHALVSAIIALARISLLRGRNEVLRAEHEGVSHLPESWFDELDRKLNIAEGKLNQ